MGENHSSESRSSRGARWRSMILLLRIVLFVGIMVLIVLAVLGHRPEWLTGIPDSPVALVVASAVYAVLMAVPFVPAVEIGLVIMVMFGSTGVVVAYLATFVGLNLAYGVGRLLGDRIGHDRLRMPDHLKDRLERLTCRLPKGSVPVGALAVLLNLPANMAIGGGGGVALAYGASRGLRWPVFALTVALATAVVPALFLLGLVSAESFGLRGS